MKISQRQAQLWRHRALEAEKMLLRQRRSWAQEWPDGIQIAVLGEVPSDVFSAIKTARKLRHAVVVADMNSKLVFFGMPLPELT